MQNVFLKHYLCGIVKYLQESNKLDAEKELNNLGKDIGKRFALLNGFKVDNDLSSLIYRIVFEFLPNIYETERQILKLEENEDSILFLIYEGYPLLPSVDPIRNTFCPSSLFAGIIESMLTILDENLKVFAYNKPSQELPLQVVYAVKRSLNV